MNLLDAIYVDGQGAITDSTFILENYLKTGPDEYAIFGYKKRDFILTLHDIGETGKDENLAAEIELSIYHRLEEYFLNFHIESIYIDGNMPIKDYHKEVIKKANAYLKEVKDSWIDILEKYLNLINDIDQKHFIEAVVNCARYEKSNAQSS